MKKSKSKAAYTNKWLFRNTQHWKEIEYKGARVIIIKKLDAPKIVIERIEEINRKRIANKQLAVSGLIKVLNRYNKEHPIQRHQK